MCCSVLGMNTYWLFFCALWRKKKNGLKNSLWVEMQTGYGGILEVFAGCANNILKDISEKVENKITLKVCSI